MTLSEQEIRDRALFDRIAASYSAKDLSRSSRSARLLRLVQTIRSVPVDGEIPCWRWAVAPDSPYPISGGGSGNMWGWTTPVS